jgi:hypothetical protein
VSFEGIDFDHLPGVDYEVYLNLPEGARPSPTGPNYVGTLTFFGSRHSPSIGGAAGGAAHAHRTPIYDKLTVPAALQQALAAKMDGVADVRITLVPDTGTSPVGNKAALAAAPDRPGIVVRQVRLLVVR